VEHTLQGNTAHLKERTLGLEVFGREPDYDFRARPNPLKTQAQTSPGLWTCASKRQDASETVQDNSRAEVLILVMDRSKCERRITQKASRGQSLFACSCG
jgi:hypothetical protein